MQRTNLLGHPALQLVKDTYADYIIYLNDVRLPTGIAVFKISIRAGFDVGMQNNTTQADMFREKYKAQPPIVFQDLYKQFGLITVKVEKEVQLRDYQSKAAPAVVNQVKESQASKTAGETSIPVAVAIVAAGVVATLAGAGAAAAAGAGGGGDVDMAPRGAGSNAAGGGGAGGAAGGGPLIEIVRPSGALKSSIVVLEIGRAHV